MNTQEKGITMKEMCETIVKARILEKSNKLPYTADEIFKYSSSGELSMIFEWYEVACNVLNIKNIFLPFIANNQIN